MCTISSTVIQITRSWDRVELETGLLMIDIAEHLLRLEVRISLTNSNQSLDSTENREM